MSNSIPLYFYYFLRYVLLLTQVKYYIHSLNPKRTLHDNNKPNILNISSIPMYQITYKYIDPFRHNFENCLPP